ncbi:MAG: isoprenylcysteine carboxylmethyltransferase family protein [Cyclobacteriaceae bacterium]
MSQSYLIIGIFWVVYFGLHSFFAADGVKSWFERSLPFIYRRYRVIYSFFSVAGMVLFAAYMSIVPSHPVWPVLATAKYAGMVLATWGVIVIKRSFKAYSLREFLGIRKEEPTELVVDGLQSKVRHPLYSGTILVILGLFLYSPTYEILITMLLAFAYLGIGIHLEEKKLLKTFGDQYADYRKDVPMLIPKIRF